MTSVGPAVLCLLCIPLASGVAPDLFFRWIRHRDAQGTRRKRSGASDLAATDGTRDRGREEAGLRTHAATGGLLYLKLDGKEVEDAAVNERKRADVEGMLSPIVASYEFGAALLAETPPQLLQMLTQMLPDMEHVTNSPGRANETMLGVFWASGGWQSRGEPYKSQLKKGSEKGVIAKTLVNEDRKEVVTLVLMNLGKEFSEKQAAMEPLSEHLLKEKEESSRSHLRYAAFAIGDTNSRICLTLEERRSFGIDADPIKWQNLSTIVPQLEERWKTDYPTLDSLDCGNQGKHELEPINGLFLFSDGNRPWTYRRWCSSQGQEKADDVFLGCDACVDACASTGSKREACVRKDCESWCRSTKQLGLECLQVGLLDRIGFYKSNTFGCVQDVESFDDWCTGDHSAIRGTLDLDRVHGTCAESLACEALPSRS